MGAEASCHGCLREQCVRIEGPPTSESPPPSMQAQPSMVRLDSGRLDNRLEEGAPVDEDEVWVPPTCLEESHIEALLGSLPDAKRRQLASPGFVERCSVAFAELDRDGTGILEGQELADAVHRALPDSFLSGRLHCEDVSALALAFDEDMDQQISAKEFKRFCMWATAMEYHGFFSGTAPVAQVAEVRSEPAKRLLLVSEFLDPERILGQLVHPSVRAVYYHPDGLTMDEFSAQLESAAFIRKKKGHLFESVALANHGPDEDGLWHVCADYPVHLTSTHEAWGALMPFFHALADMVISPSYVGHVDLMACNFAATTGGRECLSMIEREVNKVAFSASTDETGNAAQGGDWVLERGDRNVAPIYFDESRLWQFQTCMKPASRMHHSRSRTSSSSRSAARRSTAELRRGTAEMPSAKSKCNLLASAVANSKTALSLADVDTFAAQQPSPADGARVANASLWGSSGAESGLRAGERRVEPLRDHRSTGRRGTGQRYYRGAEGDPLAMSPSSSTNSSAFCRGTASLDSRSFRGGSKASAAGSRAT